jgi:hypothetical protein
MAAQITVSGRAQLEEFEKRRHDRVAAYLGAVTGSIALAWQIASELLKH